LRHKEHITAQNSADHSLYMARKIITQAGDHLDEQTRVGVEEKLGSLQTAVEGASTEAILNAIDALNVALQPVHKIVYTINNRTSSNNEQKPTDGAPNEPAADQDSATDSHAKPEDTSAKPEKPESSPE
jgi:uncharacterized protein YqgV (UPF0045/DUF77 family)